VSSVFCLLSFFIHLSIGFFTESHLWKITMLHSASLLLVSLLAALPVNADGLYTKNSPVIQLNPKTYNSLIANSNYTSVSVYSLLQMRKTNGLLL
jgi:hypothetical protein